MENTDAQIRGPQNPPDSTSRGTGVGPGGPPARRRKAPWRILFVMLVPFEGFMELQTVLGRDKFAEICFGPRPSAGLPKRAA